MKKSHRFIHLALTYLAFVSGAYAEDKYVTPVREQIVNEVATRLPGMDKACEKHMNYLRSGDEFVASLLKSPDGCKRQIGSIMDKAIKDGADACMTSFDPTVRAVMERSLNETFDVQGLQCSARDAMLAPCPECNSTILPVREIITTMSTQDLDRSLDIYVDFDNAYFDKTQKKWLPKRSKLEALAQQYGCRDFNFDAAVSTIASYENEIIKGAQISARGYKRGPLAAPPRIKQEPIPGARFLGKSRTELDPVRIAGGSNGSLNNANRGASQKASSAPQAVSVTDLGNGSKAYVYQDPEHKDQSLVGIDIVDPKTGEKTTLAFPVSPEIAAKIASTKDPIKCLDLLDHAKETAIENGLTPADALKNGEKLKQKLAAQNDAQEKAKIADGNSKSNSDDPNANATGPADGKNVAQADSTPPVGKTDSGVPIIDKSTAHKSGATASDAEPSNEKNSTASTTPDSTAETKDSISPEFRVGQGIGPSNGVKIDGIGTGTGLKYGGGVGLRGAQKIQSPSQAAKADPAVTESAQPSQLDQSTAQAGSDQTDPDHAANPEQALVNNLASRSSLSEPNGVEHKPNRTPTQSDSKTGSKADSTQARNPGQEIVTNLSSRTSNSEPNGVPGYDVDSSPAGAKSQDSDSNSSQSSGQKTEKKAVKKNSKPAAKAQAPTKKPAQVAANKPALKAVTQATPKTPSKKPVATQGATSSSKETSGKQASKSTSRAKPSTSSGITFSSESIGQVRYFLVNKPPYKPYVGRVIQVNGKTQVMMYSTKANEAQLKSMSHDSKQLRVEFESQNHADPYEYRTLSLDPDVSNRAIEEALINQVLKR